MKRDKIKYSKEYRLKNKERINAYMVEYHLKNKEHRKKYHKEWSLKNKDHLHKYKLAWQKNRIRTNENFRLKKNLRKRCWEALKGRSKSASTMKLIGCTIEELWVHLESKFESWMTRENYGSVGGWDIDHIQACAKFDLTDSAQQHECMNWSNLQPMGHIENMKKGAR